MKKRRDETKTKEWDIRERAHFMDWLSALIDFSETTSGERLWGLLCTASEDPWSIRKAVATWEKEFAVNTSFLRNTVEEVLRQIEAVDEAGAIVLPPKARTYQEQIALQRKRNLPTPLHVERSGVRWGG